MASPQPKDQHRPEDNRYAIWDLYNQKAKIRDKAILKDWGYNINNLLLFPAIFASVLTSFCIESRQLLEQDPLSIIQQTVVYMAERDRNSSTPFPQIPPFTPEPWAVAVNAYFFTSLTFGILASIGAVMCQQWIGEYEAGLETASTPEQRALRGHYRYRATKQWYMNQLIAGLPILLYIAVALFFVGLAIWFRHVYPRLALIPLFGLIGVATYFIAAIFAVFYPSAPYRTSISRYLFRITWLTDFYIWYITQSIWILWDPFMSFFMDLIKDTGNELRRFFSQHAERTGKDKIQQYRDNLIVAKALHEREIKTRRTQAYPWIPPGGNHWQSMHAGIWERGSVIRDHTLHLSALTWLANSIHLSAHFKAYFKLLLKELNSIDERRLRDWSVYNSDAPWSHIFNLVLASPHTTTGAKSPSDEVPRSASPAFNSPARPLSVDAGSVGPFSSYTRVEAPSAVQDLEMIPTLAGLLRKMSDHPLLFERMISRMSSALMVAFMEHLASHRPATKEQARSRLVSITALFSSKRWKRMAQDVQPIYPTFKVILDCLKFGEMKDYEKSAKWLFTLCYVDEWHSNDEENSTLHVPWPNPEFISVISYALKSDDLRRRSIAYYIDYLDALLTKSDLPSSGNRRWRWHRVEETQDVSSQIAMLRILAEYLLPSWMAVEDHVERRNNSNFLEECATNIKDPALRLIVQAFSGGQIDELPPDRDPKWQDEVWLCAAMASVHLNGREEQSYDVSAVVAPAARVMAAIINANKSIPNAMLQDLITRNIGRMNSEHWIAIMSVLSKRRDRSELEQFASWMIALVPAKWLTVFTHFFESPSPALEPSVLEILLDTLLDNLPHRLAQKRWHAAVDRIIQSEGRIEGFRRVVDIVLLRQKNSQFDGLSLVRSPLPGILDKMREELEGVTKKAERSRVKPYVRIMNDLTRRYAQKHSVDEGFLSRFQGIANELTRISTNFGDTTKVDNLASPGTPSPLQELLNRVQGLGGTDTSVHSYRSPTLYDPLYRLYSRVT